MSDWADFWDNLFLGGYWKKQCQQYEQLYRDAAEDLIQCGKKRVAVEEKIRQLKLLVPRPTPPDVRYVERDTTWVQQRLQSYGLNIIRLPLDAIYRFPANRKEAMKILSWDWTDELQYVKDHFDCPDFAMHLMVMTNLFFRIQFCWVIDYASAHSYNLILIPDSTDLVCEPQTDALHLWTKRPEQFYYLKGAPVAI